VGLALSADLDRLGHWKFLEGLRFARKVNSGFGNIQTAQWSQAQLLLLVSDESNHPRKTLMTLFGQVVIEQHANGANEQAPGWLHQQVFVCQFDQPIGCHLLEHGPGTGEI
jgi:hypothetical protein